MKGFPGGSDGKESAYNARDPWFDPWVGKIPWRRAYIPTLVFLPGEFHRQRSLAGYNPWGHKESDTTKQLTLTFSSVNVKPEILIEPIMGSIIIE